MSEVLQRSTTPPAATPVVALAADESSLALARHVKAAGLVFLNPSFAVVGSLDEARSEWS